MRKQVSILITFCTMFLLNGAYAQVLDKGTIELKVDALIPESVKDTTPGLIIGIVQDGKLIFEKGYGMANLSYEIDNDPKMVYNLGSVSKQFLGYAFAMLHVAGKLNIDDPVHNYLNDWPEFDQEVTLRHLLTHSSGYREAYTMSNLAGRMIGVDRLSREECLEVVRRQPALEFEPGSRYTYNSTAWVILAEVLKSVTGTEADEWVEEHILAPLEMNDTQIESYVGEVIHNAAESYSHSSDNGYQNEKSNRAIFGAAEVYSNVTDLSKWVDNYKTAGLGGKEVKALFLDPFILNDGTNSEYALGIRVGLYRGLERYRHTGGHEAFSTQLSYYPEHDLGIITVSNYGGKGWVSTSKVAEIFLEEFMEKPVDEQILDIKLKKKVLEEYAGLYLSPSVNRSLKIRIDADTLHTSNGDQLISTSQNTFMIKGWDGKVTLDKDGEGEIKLVFDDGTKSIYNKVNPWSPDEKELKAYAGKYWSEELETAYELQMVDHTLTLRHRWMQDIRLNPVTKNVFKTAGGYFYLEFHRNANKEIESFNVNSPRTLGVKFYAKNE